MNPLLLSILLAAVQPLADNPIAPPPAPAAEASAYPSGAPREDYQFVGWCYGALRGYLDMHDEVMPEVTRIESTFRNPQRKLSDDLKVYADMQAAGRRQLPGFQAAMTAAEKASLRPINALGARAIVQGRNIWLAGPQVTKARKAQEWMSWTLPARCETVARSLISRAALMGPAFQVNADQPTADETPAAAASPPAPADHTP